MMAIDIVENELNDSKRKLQLLEDDKNNKLRLVEINTYFGDKYAENSQLMKIIIFTLIPVIILALLNNKGILPNRIYYILLVIVVFIGGYFFWRRFASIIMRDNMNYQEYVWSFDPNNISTGSSTTSDPWTGGLNLGTCVGDACCSPGLSYNSSRNQCMSSSGEKSFVTESFITESMVNDVLTKKEVGKYKDSVNLRQPEPFNNYR
jgi:hypothetical protein